MKSWGLGINICESKKEESYISYTPGCCSKSFDFSIERFCCCIGTSVHTENLKEIIWTMNSNFDKLEDFVIYIRSYSIEFFDNSSIELQFIAPTTYPEILLPGELRRNLFLCIKEALNNIVKHSKAGKATLTLQIIDNILTIDIRDDGIGIDSNKLNKFGNGLTTMKKRLEKYGGSMGISVNNGTKLSFKVLLDCTVETK